MQLPDIHPNQAAAPQSGRDDSDWWLDTLLSAAQTSKHIHFLEFLTRSGRMTADNSSLQDRLQTARDELVQQQQKIVYLLGSSATCVCFDQPKPRLLQGEIDDISCNGGMIKLDTLTGLEEIAYASFVADPQRPYAQAKALINFQTNEPFRF